VYTGGHLSEELDFNCQVDIVGHSKQQVPLEEFSDNEVSWLNNSCNLFLTFNIHNYSSNVHINAGRKLNIVCGVFCLR